MKKFLALFLTGFILSNTVVMALEETAAATVEPPKWEDYVPEKYQNPRPFKRGKSIGELSTGIVLTELLITAPIGVPMIVHSTTKLKNQGYYDKKIKFDAGLAEAEKITNPAEKQAYYDDLIVQCKFKEKIKQKNEKKRAKQAQKEAKKAIKTN